MSTEERLKILIDRWGNSIVFFKKDGSILARRSVNTFEACKLDLELIFQNEIKSSEKRKEAVPCRN